MSGWVVNRPFGNKSDKYQNTDKSEYAPEVAANAVLVMHRYPYVRDASSIIMIYAPGQWCTAERL